MFPSILIRLQQVVWNLQWISVLIDPNFEDAERLAHNLHGVAGSFGAKRLKEASKALELALAKGESANLIGLAQSFEIALAEVLESAEALASNEIQFRASDFDANRERDTDTQDTAG